MTVNLFFIGLEFFTAYYSGIPGHSHSLEYLFFGLDGHDGLVPFMWTSMGLAILALVLLINPSTRNNERWLATGAAAVFFSTWLDKGLGLVVGGFIPSPFESITEYSPTAPELIISLGCGRLVFSYSRCFTNYGRGTGRS